MCVHQTQKTASGTPFRLNRRDKSRIEKLLKAITEKDFSGCFQNWKKRYHKCLVSDGEYFEGDEIDFKE